MRVRISYTVEVDDHFRRAISHHYGVAHKATRYEVQAWFREFGESADDDVVQDLDEFEAYEANE